MTRVVIKKIAPIWFEQILLGKKKYELRLNDFEVEEGDTLLLEEWTENPKAPTGRKIEKKVTSVGKFRIGELYWPKEEILEKGLQILSLE